jgi:hypothetical protein
MLKFKKIEGKKIGGFLKKLPKVLGEKAFLTYLGLLVLALILGGFIFYQYNILAKKTEVQVTEKLLGFEKEVYDKVLKIWQEKEENFEGADFKEYPNLFR